MAVPAPGAARRACVPLPSPLLFAGLAAFFPQLGAVGNLDPAHAPA